VRALTDAATAIRDRGDFSLLDAAAERSDDKRVVVCIAVLPRLHLSSLRSS